jgi:hypothetical protein
MLPRQQLSQYSRFRIGPNIAVLILGIPLAVWSRSEIICSFFAQYIVFLTKFRFIGGSNRKSSLIAIPFDWDRHFLISESGERLYGKHKICEACWVMRSFENGTVWSRDIVWSMRGVLEKKSNECPWLDIRVAFTEQYTWRQTWKVTSIRFVIRMTSRTINH